MVWTWSFSFFCKPWFQGVPSILSLQFGEVVGEESLTNGWGFGADFAEAAAAELVAGGVVHGPVVAIGVGFVDGEEIAQVVEPFDELVVGAVGEAPGESVGFFKHDLRCVDDDPADGSGEKHTPGEGVESHLVVGLVLAKVVWAEGGGGGFAVHDQELVVERDYAIEMAGEEVGLGGAVATGAEVEFEPEAELYGGGTVGFDVGGGWVGVEVVEVVNNQSNERLPILIFTCLSVLV